MNKMPEKAHNEEPQDFGTGQKFRLFWEKRSFSKFQENLFKKHLTKAPG